MNDIEDIDKTFNALKRLPYKQMYELYLDLSVNASTPETWLIIRDKLFNDNGWIFDDFNKIRYRDAL